MAIPVIAPLGAIRGCWWSLGTSAHYFLGKFESAKARAVALAVQEGDVAWDIGAHRGYFTLVIGRAAGFGGTVYSFEPDPCNQVLLRRHVRWNRRQNTTVFPMALSNQVGQFRFKQGESSLAGKLADDGELLVSVQVPRKLVDDGTCKPPTFIKLDAEGAEYDILIGFGLLLDNPRCCLVISTDSLELHLSCSKLLADKGYTIVDSGKRTMKDAWERFHDVEFFAFGAERPPSTELISLIELIGHDK